MYDSGAGGQSRPGSHRQWDTPRPISKGSPNVNAAPPRFYFILSPFVRQKGFWYAHPPCPVHHACTSYLTPFVLWGSLRDTVLMRPRRAVQNGLVRR